MPSSQNVDPHALVAAIQAITPWLINADDQPDRTAVATAVRLSLRTLAQIEPGCSVEVRVPPFAAVQCVGGPRHTRGTPPNVIETDPRTWLLLATGRTQWQDAVASGLVHASGTRASLEQLLPIVKG